MKQNYNIHAYYSFGNSYSCITAVEWDAYDVENTAGNARCMHDAEFIRRIHSAFIPLTGLKCSYGKIFSPLTEIPVGKTEISGTEPARSLRLCSHGTGPKWIRPYPGTDHFCSHGTVPLINVCPHGTGLLLFGTESK